MATMVAVPDPLSLIPGPVGTESRWAPTTTVSDASPPGASARRFVVVRVSLIVVVTSRTSTRPVAASAASSLPTAKVATIAGMANGRPSVTSGSPLRPGTPGVPSLKSTRPAAPAVSAFAAFTSISHVPRCTSAIAPAGKPAKSASSQPLVLVLAVGPGGSVRSTGTRGPVTAAAPENSSVATSLPAT